MEPGWADLKRFMTTSGRSADWEAAGLWALEALETRLGSAWPGWAWERHGPHQPPALLLWPSAHTVAFAELLELALRLESLDRVPGAAKVRDKLRQDPQPHQLSHVQLQLELASLAARRTPDVKLETKFLGASTPADVVICGSSPVAVETFVHRRDLPSCEVQSVTDEVMDRLFAIRLHQGVLFPERRLHLLLHHRCPRLCRENHTRASPRLSAVER